MIEKILVTGATGFVGRTLLPTLRKAYPQAHIVALSRTAVASDNNPLKIEFDRCDLADTKAITTLVEKLQPTHVINLAAVSHIPTAFEFPERTWQVNLHGVLSLLNALSKQAQPCTFLQIGSGDCYGKSFASGEKLDENSAFMPLNPYSASKAAADLAAFSFCQHPHLTIIRARPFNHSGAGQSAEFVIPAFAKQIAQIEVGQQPPIMQVGNLAAKRCFLHVEDVVNAYILLLQAKENITSGSAFNIVAEAPVSIEAILKKLFIQPYTHIKVQQDPTRQRPTDIPIAQGSTEALQRCTGWTTSVSLNTLLTEVLTDQRQQLIRPLKHKV